MILFFLKKNFCDGWDNMLSLVLPNLIMTAFFIGSYFAIGAVLTLNPIAGIITQVVAIYILITAIFAFGNSAARIANFKSVSIKEYLAEFKHVWKDSLLFAILAGALFLFAFVGFPFYLQMGSLIGIFLAALVFWFLIISLLALQWFLPIRSLMQNNFRKCLKKSFIIFFDNPGFSVFIFLYTLFLIVLSCVLFFILPGWSGIILAHTNALRLRLYKYDWYETHPELSPKERKHIPWDELIAEDYDTLGPRSIKSFIFPWK